jgi:hypothetical protein
MERGDVTRTMLGRDDECQRLTDRGVRRVTEQALGQVPRRNRALAIDGDDRIARGGDRGSLDSLTSGLLTSSC